MVIPATLKEIPTAAFNTQTNLESITFEEGSNVTKIGTQAFASTNIKEFDFSPCKKLEGLNDGVFVQTTIGDGANVNSRITKVTLPTSPLFKHINGAFRNLTALTEIVNLDQSFVQEIVGKAFENTANEKLSLPGKNLQYIAWNALEGSKVEDLEIDVTKLQLLGGCEITYEESTENEGEYVYNYYNSNPEYDAEANLYNNTETAENKIEAKEVLAKLTLKGTLQGKISKNAFLNCVKLDGSNLLKDLYYGSQAQIETNAFKGCKKITTLTINNISDDQLLNEEYTISEKAFEGCPITDLTIGDITTDNAIGQEAFGTSLKNVTIGTVKAMNGAFAEGAFDLSKVGTNTTKKYTAKVQIGDIKSKGGVFAAGALVGTKIVEIDFKGINTNGLNVATVEADGSQLSKLVFDGAIATSGISGNAFANFSELASVEFNALLAENAVDQFAFANSGDVADADSAKSILKVKYTYADIEDYTVNPFNPWAFVETEDNAETVARVIEWTVANEELSNYIALAIHRDAVEAADEVYDGEVVSTKFNVYKWIDILAKPDVEEPIAATAFIVYQEGSTKTAWGRYDLGSFTLEKGKEGTYSRTNMYIPRYQTVELS